MSSEITEKELIAELEAMESVEERIDAVADDFENDRNRYAAVNVWKLGELLGVDFDDSADWGRNFYEDVVHATTSLTSSSGEILEFEVCIGDGGEPFDAQTPYSLARGEGFDDSDHVWIE